MYEVSSIVNQQRKDWYYVGHEGGGAERDWQGQHDACQLESQ